MAVRITATYAISVYHHKRCAFESRPGEMYSIQHYVIKFISDLRQVDDFCGTPISSTNKTDRYNITELLLKVVLNIISQSNIPFAHFPDFIIKLNDFFTFFVRVISLTYQV
jgi:hypothetical protein